MRIFYTVLLCIFSLWTSAQTERSFSVYFDFDKWALDETAKNELLEFATDYKSRYLDHTEKPKITLKGYCDTIGSLSYNDRLAQQRVFTVHNFLLNNGLPKNVFELVKGYGKRMPVNSNITEEERRLNRRVDISLPLEETTPPPPPPVPEPPVVEPPVDTVKDFTSTSIDSVKQGDVLRLKNINFYGGRHTFLPQSIPALNELLDVMKKYPKLEIEIQGHICCRIGSGVDGADFDSGDEQLSVNRARAVYYFLADNGISKRRMTYRGFAALYPLINPEISEADRTLNRRVEIRITKK